MWLNEVESRLVKENDIVHWKMDLQDSNQAEVYV